MKLAKTLSAVFALALLSGCASQHEEMTGGEGQSEGSCCKAGDAKSSCCDGAAKTEATKADEKAAPKN